MGYDFDRLIDDVVIACSEI